MFLLLLGYPADLQEGKPSTPRTQGHNRFLTATLASSTAIGADPVLKMRGHEEETWP